MVTLPISKSLGFIKKNFYFIEDYVESKGTVDLKSRVSKTFKARVFNFSPVLMKLGEDNQNISRKKIFILMKSDSRSVILFSILEGK